MITKFIYRTGLVMISGFPFFGQAQTLVEFDPSCVRYINQTTELDRSKYFNIHSSGNDAEHTALYQDYNVGQGRGFWGAFSAAKQQTGEVGEYPSLKTGDQSLRPVNRKIGTEHPSSAFKDGMDIEKAGDWAVNYFNYWVSDEERPEYFEVMNEPFVHAKDFYQGGWNNDENQRIKRQMAELYASVGRKMNQAPSLANMKVIGYSSAWPSMELQDFGHWNDNMQLFMDIAGEEMHAFATHLYDGVNVEGQDNKRSGSNAEAILDLIENYSYIKWDEVKPHAISEYGAIEKGYGDDYSDLASIQTVRSINHILFSLLEREDRMEISIPFITGKAQWHINEANNYQPYQAVLWKPTNIGEPNPAGWEYTPRIHFYELWKEVRGNRVWVKSNNPDIQVQAFLEGKKVFLALNNLDDQEQQIQLSNFAKVETSAVTTKRLKIYADQLPEMSVEEATAIPAALTMVAGETLVMEITLAEAPSASNTVHTKHYYSKQYLQPIVQGEAIAYSFGGVEKSADGYAYLRMSIGRKHDRSKQPVVMVNGHEVAVPDNWKGYDQANREDFFGMIEIPVPYAFLQEENEVSVTFPDSNGRISSLILQVHSFDEPQQQLVVGLKDKNKNQNGFKFYPNPTERMLSISWDKELGDDDPQVNLYSQEGFEIRAMQTKFLPQKALLDLGDLRPGLYTAYIHMGGQSAYGKVIKK